jgi:hypothetical protein
VFNGSGDPDLTHIDHNLLGLHPLEIDHQLKGVFHFPVAECVVNYRGPFSPLQVLRLSLLPNSVDAKSMRSQMGSIFMYV